MVKNKKKKILYYKIIDNLGLTKIILFLFYRINHTYFRMEEMAQYVYYRI